MDEGVIEKQGRVKGRNKKQIRKISEEYLAKQNIYFITVGKSGIMPHEFKDPLTEIPQMLKQLKVILGKTGQADELDVDANMRRCRRLFEKVSAEAQK